MRPAVLVTAGPTRERIDPVRFISNYSTGIFGYEIAREAARRGYPTVLISGPASIKAPSGVKFIAVESAEEMRRAVKREYKKCGYTIMAAAVCDWRIKSPAKRKIKRSGITRTLEFVENADILKELGRNKQGVLVGFALETDALEKNALKKLKEKNLDFVIGTRLNKSSPAFGDKDIDISIIDRSGNKEHFRNKDKRVLAGMILDKVLI